MALTANTLALGLAAPFRRVKSVAKSAPRISFSSSTTFGTTLARRFPAVSYVSAAIRTPVTARVVNPSRSTPGPGTEVKMDVQGKHLELTDAIRAHVNQKLRNAISHFEVGVREVHVRCSARGLGKQGRHVGEQLQKCEVTVFAKAGVVRAEVEADDLYAAVDKVSDKITRKLRKLKERQTAKGAVKRAHKKLPREAIEAAVDEALTADLIQAEAEKDFEYNEIVREKFFAVDECSTEEAVQRLEDLGHDFYAFLSSSSQEINIVYRRKAGGYGLLIPTDMRPATAE